MRLIKVLVMIAVFGLNSAYAERGGISGGGGGTTTPGKVTIQQVESAALGSKLLILEWLHEQEQFFLDVRHGQNPEHPVYEKMFSKPGLYELIAGIKLELRSEGPCHWNGEETDGSADLADPTRVCISSKNLAEKLHVYNYDWETAALILHEISHLMGANEAEATEIQTDAIYGLKTYTDLNERVRLKVRALGDIEDFLVEATYFVKPLLKRGLVTCSQADQLQDKYVQLINQLPDPYLNLYALDATWRDGTRSHMAKMEAFTLGACMLKPSEGLQDYYRERFEKGFQGDTEIRSDVFLNRILNSDLYTPGRMPVQIRRTDNVGALEAELTEIETFVRTIHKQIMDLTEGRFEVVR